MKIDTYVNKSPYHLQSEVNGKFPTGNNVHVTCMFHANFINLHAQQNMHVIMLMYKHVSCNMQGFRTFSMHVTCMLHA